MPRLIRHIELQFNPETGEWCSTTQAGARDINGLIEQQVRAFASECLDGDQAIEEWIAEHGDTVRVR